MQLEELQSKLETGHAIQVEVHAIEQIIYLVYERQGEDLHPFRDAQGAVLKFRSLNAAKTALRETGLERIEFVHNSSYGEMIGAPGGYQDTQMRQQMFLAESP